MSALNQTQTHLIEEVLLPEEAGPTFAPSMKVSLLPNIPKSSISLN
jgi:hypothetical protein